MTDQADTVFFAHRLAQQKQYFDEVISDYWEYALPQTQQTYGDASFQAMVVLAEFVNRGGKRIRASLAEQAYRMFGGNDQQAIDDMALALELIHAYLLITDDINDKSDMRRGGPAAHKQLAHWHAEANLQGDAGHFGVSIATLAAMTAQHLAMARIATLPISAERRVAALQNLNQLLVTTCHGQINDIYNQAIATHNSEAAEHVLLWKTAYYSFVNPLQLGAILAGAPQEALDVFERYGLATGRAFQISDDIISLFGDTDVTGKSTMDDLREGKRTLLILKTFQTVNNKDVAFLESQLGNPNLTEDAFRRCQHIIRDSGALAYASKELNASCEIAKEVLLGSSLPDGDGIRFLRGLTDYLKERKS